MYKRKKMERYTIGDIHGRVKALKQVLKKVKFNYNNDKLIVLGDVADGGYNTYQVVEELLKIKNLIYIIGNHDEWFMNHIKTGWAEEIWLSQGGSNTLRSYGAKVIDANTHHQFTQLNTNNIKIPVTHQNFFNRGVYYHIEDNMIFVHGGFNPKIPLMTSQSKKDLLWDRDLINYARRGNIIEPYDSVFVGHTTTQTYGMDIPIQFKNLYMMDCGAGWNGCLAIMNIDTKKFEVSDKQSPIRTNHLTDNSYKRVLKEMGL